MNEPWPMKPKRNVRLMNRKYLMREAVSSSSRSLRRIEREREMQIRRMNLNPKSRWRGRRLANYRISSEVNDQL